MSDEGAFRVTRRLADMKRVVLLTTDDGLEAEVFVHDLRRKERSTNRTFDYSLRIEGYDPTHDDNGTGTCGRCGTPLNNGCFGSHLPCGPRPQKALLTLMDEWRAAHAAAEDAADG